MFTKLKMSFRRNYLLFKYKHNDKTGKLVYVKSSDRGLGLSTVLMKESLSTNTPILVRTCTAKRYMAHQMYLLGQLNFANSRTEDYIYNHLLVSCQEMKNYKRGCKKNYCILVDNDCSSWDVINAMGSNYFQIKNGFVTEHLMS